ncbi:DUF294 nucleotidyltransferase-like domain-containing protein [Paenibacillus physcomitrellae]|uniref:Signal transduction protein n=1 Tax=Paenibacillus physcomitrellae TaxID=1619311 RepID=A0ABQ1GIN7_9BACL|nr:DUF294 nucleotidyltransferase-like domain-containing protein [Paenibacillus physcomitrellae]GGA44548.1 hypothetical protein GCM10010917_32310 [Paenibacillus physcomitrellae]
MKEAASPTIDLSSIHSAETSSELRLARWKEENKLLQLFSSVPIEDWNESVNRLQDEVMVQAISICERELAEAGAGVPPVPFAFVLFGSGGREEQTPWSDQDNGLIYADGGGAAADQYFEQFGLVLARILEETGYPPCKGKVMVSNPMWRLSLFGWHQQLADWREELRWEDVRYLTIASDLRCIAGDRQLAAEWRSDFMQLMSSNEELEAALLGNTVRHKAALNVLGQVITERFGEHAGEFDVKYGLYIPLVNGIRCIALYYGINETSTQDRILKLHELEAFPRPWIDALRRAFTKSLKFRSLTNRYTEDGVLQGDSYLTQETLKQKDVSRELRESLHTVRQLYRMLQRQHRFAERRLP